MKLKYKLLLVAALIIGAIAVIYFFSNSKPSENTTTEDTPIIDRAALILSLQTLEYKIPELTDEQKEKYYEQFKQERDSLNEAMEVINREGEQAAPLLYWPLVYLGSINRDVGDLEKAEKAYLYAHQLQPGAFVPLGNLGELYFRYLKDYNKAAAYYLRAVDIESSYLATYYSELFELHKYFIKDEKKAEQILIDGVKKYPQDTEILALLATYYRDTGQKEKAIERYHEWLTINPDSEVAKQALKELIP